MLELKIKEGFEILVSYCYSVRIKAISFPDSWIYIIHPVHHRH